MSLLPPSEGLSAATDTLLIAQIQEHARLEGYAVVKQRSKNSRAGVLDKVWLRCTRGGKIRVPTGQKRKHESSRLNDCPFQCVLKLDKGSNEWLLAVKDASHNHDPSKQVAQTVHRKAALTSSVQETIMTQTNGRAAPNDIIHSLHQGLDEEDPVFKHRDIYNLKAAMRRQKLGPLSPIQALIRSLHASDGDWYVKFLKDQKDRVTHLFFSRKSCHETLKENWEVLIMDCTYKTNRYRLPLLIIYGVNALGGCFYVAFCFLAAEQEEDYLWALHRYRDMCVELDIQDPIINITDREVALINAHYVVLPNSAHMLCVWHVNKNVVAKCYLKFKAKEDWADFYAHWFRVIYATTVAIFEGEWKSLQEVYNRHDPEICQYLSNVWINPYKTKIVRCYTNQIRHFFNTVSSKGEGGHAGLKRELRVSTGKRTSICIPL